MTQLKLFAYPAIALISIAAAGTCLAADRVELRGEIVQPVATATAPAKSREQIAQELTAARADGSIKAWSSGYNPLALMKSVKTREEVRAEAVAARAQSAAFASEDSGSFALSRNPAARVAPALYAGQGSQGSGQ